MIQNEIDLLRRKIKEREKDIQDYEINFKIIDDKEIDLINK